MNSMSKSAFTVLLASVLHGWVASPAAWAAGANVVPPKGSTCKKKYDDDTDNYCTFPDGSKWLCDENLDNCIRLRKTLPGKKMKAPESLKNAPTNQIPDKGKGNGTKRYQAPAPGLRRVK
jgi:hypothetical protein